MGFAKSQMNLICMEGAFGEALCNDQTAFGLFDTSASTPLGNVLKLTASILGVCQIDVC